MSTWKQKVIDLEAAGWSLTRIGQYIELSAQGVSDIKQGRTSEPRGMAAVRLHDLHLQVQRERALADQARAA